MQKLFQKKSWLVFNILLFCFGFIHAKDKGVEPNLEAGKESLSVNALKDLKKIKESPSEFKLDFSQGYLLSGKDISITLSATKMDIPISGKQVLLSVDDLKGEFSPCQSSTEEEGRLICQTQTTKDGDFSIRFHSSQKLDRLLRFDVYFLDGRTGYVQHMQERIVPYYSTPIFYASSIVLVLLFIFLIVMMIFKNFFPSLGPYFSLSLYYRIWFVKNMTKKEMGKLLGFFSLLYVLWALPLGSEMLHFYILSLVALFFFFHPFLLKYTRLEDSGKSSFFVSLILVWSVSAIYLVHYRDLLSSGHWMIFLSLIFLLSPILSLLMASLLSLHGFLWVGYYHGVYFLLLLVYGLTFLEKEKGVFKKMGLLLKQKLLKKKH